MKLTKLFAMMLFLASPASAFIVIPLTFNLDTVTETDVTPPTGNAPWATATFNDLGLNEVEFTLSLNLTGDEFMSSFSFNLDPALSITDLTFSNPNETGQFDLYSITRALNGVRAGQGTRFDFAIDFNTSNAAGGSRRFNETDSLQYVISNRGPNTFSSQSFNQLDATGNSYVMGHVQGIGNDNTSAWINPSQIPEPQAALLGMLGLITLLRRRK